MLLEKHKFPEKLEVHITEGDISCGYREVYLAEEVDKWLRELEILLTKIAYDQMTIQHGNTAKMVLDGFF